MSQAPLARRFAEYGHRLAFDNLPRETTHEVKRRLIDSIATAVGAMDADAYRIVQRCAQRTSSERPVTLFGGGKSSVEWATFLNGLLIRYLDYNDTYLSLEPAHPSDNLAAVLSVGEMNRKSGKDLITAAVLAYEIQCRLCDAASLRKHGIDHVTYGAMSSCAAACKLLDLDVEKTTHALGIAGVCNVALRQTRAGEMSMWKGCAFANAARNGVFAALLASEGLTGPAPIFEGGLGFMKLISGEFSVAPLGGTGSPPQPFMINETYIKFWPAEYHSQSAIDAALQLRDDVGDVSRIKSIDVHTFDAAVDIIGKDPEKRRPKTRETADHSLPYCIALTLLDGEMSEKQFEEHRFTEPAVLGLIDKIQLHRDAEINKRYPAGIPNRLTVTMSDGRRLVKEVEHPRGHARNPMSDAEVEAKLRLMVEPRLGSDKANRILATCWDFENLQSVTELVELVQ